MLEQGQVTPGYRSTDPDISKQAFKQVNVPESEIHVLEAIYKLGGSASDEQMADWLAHVHARDEITSNISPRKRRCADGYVETCNYKTSPAKARRAAW
jgi:hypothetical protein